MERFWQHSWQLHVHWGASFDDAITGWKRKNRQNNPPYFISIYVHQVLLVEFGGDAVKTTPLNLVQWLWCIGLGACSLPIGSHSPPPTPKLFLSSNRSYHRFSASSRPDRLQMLLRSCDIRALGRWDTASAQRTSKTKNVSRRCTQSCHLEDSPEIDWSSTINILLSPL